MIQGRRITAALLVLVLSFGLVLQTQASEIDETQKKLQELEEKKKAAEEEKNALSAQLTTLMGEMEELNTQIHEKEEELEQKEEELYEAQIKENDQYESMKKRIKYMYENGNVQFVEILCQSKNIGEFLNNAEYITTISEYDREQLIRFREIVEDVKRQEAELEEEYAKLGELQEQLIEKQMNVQTMLSGKENEINSLSGELSTTAQKLEELKKAAEEAERKRKEAESGYDSNPGASVIKGNGTFTHPCPGYTRISSTFGPRKAPLPGASTYHKGLDFAAPTGTPIYAAADGTVTTARYSGNAGNLVIINHGNGLQTYYMHCHKIFVKAGQKVTKGQNIAQVGTTGNSTGPHLHFQVMSGGKAVNPMGYL